MQRMTTQNGSSDKPSWKRDGAESRRNGLSADFSERGTVQVSVRAYKSSNSGRLLGGEKHGELQKQSVAARLTSFFPSIGFSRDEKSNQQPPSKHSVMPEPSAARTVSATMGSSIASPFVERSDRIKSDFTVLPQDEVSSRNVRLQADGWTNSQSQLKHADKPGYLTPPRPGQPSRVQSRRAKELRTIGGDLMDGSPDRDFGLITDISGDTPPILRAVTHLLDRLLSHSPESWKAMLPDHETQSDVKESISVFYGKSIPPISIKDYIERMYQYGQCSPASFLHAIIYMDRLVDQYGTAVAPNNYNVHRLLLTGVVVGAKFLDDRVFSNAYYARIGGVSTQELNRMEREFVNLMEFRMMVPVSTIEAYCRGMERAHLRARDNPKAPTSPEPYTGKRASDT